MSLDIFQTHKIYNTKKNPDVNYGHGVIIMCQLGSTTVTNGPLWWGMLIVREAVHVWEQRGMANLYFLFSFAVKLKLL